jgi:phage/plasmid-associated DNA primase
MNLALTETQQKLIAAGLGSADEIPSFPEPTPKEGEPLIRFSVVTVAKGGGSVQKKIDLIDGKAVKDPEHNLGVWDGWLNGVQVRDLQEFADVAGNLKPNQALLLGECGKEGAQRLVKSADYKEIEGTITRTKKHIQQPKGVYLGLLEHDAEPGAEPITPEGFWQGLLVPLPELEGVGRVVTASSSSHIYNADTDECLKGEGNHHNFPLFTGDLDRAREIFRGRFCLHDKVFYKLSKPNSQTGVPAVLERHPIDMYVLSFERLVYEAGPMLGAGLESRRPAPKVYPGIVLDLDAIPELTPEEKEIAESNKQVAEGVVRIEQLESTIDFLVREKGIAPEKAVKVAQKAIQDCEKKLLSRDHTLFFKDGSQVAAGDLDEEKHLGENLRDPQEPDYDGGRYCAKVIRVKGGKLGISSFAHGESVYTIAPASKPSKKPTQKALKAQAKKEARAKVTDDDGIELQERFGKIAIPEIVHSQMELVTGNPTEDWICVNGKLHRWTGTHYEYVKDGIVERSILDFLRKLYIWGFADDGGEFPIPIKEYPYATARISRDCLATLKAARFLPIESIPRAGINLANGTILLSYEDGKPEFTLHPHSRDRYYLQCSPVAYDPEADTSSADTLLSAVSDTQLETFLKHQSFFFDFPGVLKLIGRPRAGICEGTGSNGKDAIRTCLEHLIGKIGSFSFEDFKAYDEGRRFNLSSLPEYQFSWSGENSHRVKLENLKSLMAAIVGNTPLVSELKGQDGQTYTPQLPLWFSLNDAPITDGAASFIKSRIAIYNFAKTYTDTPTEPNQIKADPRYAYDEDFRVKQVCPGLLVRLMEAYKRLWANGMDWKPCEGQLAEWAKTGNHLLQFGEAIGLRKQAGGNVSITALYAQLKQWYQDNDYLEIHDGRSRWLDDSRFDALVKRNGDLFARLKALFPGIEKQLDTDGRITGSKGRAYIKGLAIIPTVEAEPLPEPTTVAAAPPGPCLPAELNPDAIAQAIIEAPDGDTQRYLWYDCYIPPSIRKSSWVAIVEHPLGKTAQAEILKRNEAA